jgi:peroxiredoxin
VRDKGARPALPPGGTAPDFCLPTATGETACLRDFLAGGPVLVWFYRGHW